MRVGEPTHVHDGEAQQVTVLVNSLHDGVFGSLSHITRTIGEENFKKITFGVKPDFHGFGHRTSPALGLSVRYAVRTNASDGRYFTTAHSHLSPTCVLKY